MDYLPCEGPRFKSYEVRGGEIEVAFYNGESGFSPWHDIVGFEIYTIETINELEPTRQPEPSQKTEEQETDEEPEILAPDHGKSEGDILDEMTGQIKLF